MIDTISVTDLKQHTASVLKRVRAGRKPIVVLQRSKPVAVVIDPADYQTLEDALEDLADLKAVEERKNEPTVSARIVARKLGLR